MLLILFLEPVGLQLEHVKMAVSSSFQSANIKKRESYKVYHLSSKYLCGHDEVLLGSGLDEVLSGSGKEEVLNMIGPHQHQIFLWGAFQDKPGSNCTQVIECVKVTCTEQNCKINMISIKKV